MLTLYHAPRSRSSRIIRLLDELDALDKVTVEIVTVPRQDGSGGPDDRNPHPEKKVPMLTDGESHIRESNAIMQYLCECFPAACMAPMPGEARRGDYLGWMAYYGNVLEPLMMMRAMHVDHPLVHRTWRDLDAVFAQLAQVLEKGQYLLGERYSAADLLITSAFAWQPSIVPDLPLLRDWIERCEARPSAARLVEYEQKAMAA